jgi:hypothetical protein
MQLLTKLLLATAALALATACKKEIETITVPVDKVYSWMPFKRLYGLENVILNMGKDANSIYTQTPGILGILTPPKNPPVKNKFGYYLSAAAGLPTDIRIKIPMAADFLAVPFRDSLIELIRPTEPVTNNFNGVIRLRQLDPAAISINRPNTNWLPFGAINQNNFLLVGYYTAAFTDIRLMLSKVKVGAAGDLQTQSRTIRISSPTHPYAAIQWIVAIDNYFIVNCDAGLYKILEDGTSKRVFGVSQTDVCYKWQGVLYAVEEYNSILVSKDDGETWQRSSGTPDAFNFTSYHVIGDSLVAATHGGDNQLFTLRWNGPKYTIRALKNDGLGQSDISDLEQLGDTVYLGTTNGLFKRPLSKFFESK